MLLIDTHHRTRHALVALLLMVLGACTGDEAAQVPGPALQPVGQWLVVNYWAQWCHPCITEIPELVAFAASSRGRVRVVLVNFDGVSGAELSAQGERLGIPPELLLERDPATELGLRRPQALPSTFVLAPGGELRAVLQGAQTAAGLTRATQGN